MNVQVSPIGVHRQYNQQLAVSNFQTATEMVKWFGAVQGQEYAQTKWGLGLRLPHLTDEDIEKEIISGKLLRTHLLRPTWHLVAAEDIRWLLALTAPRVHQVNGHMYRKMELDDKVLFKSMDLITRSLEGGKQMTRNELADVFKEHGLIATGHRLSYIMMHAELEGLICDGIRRGKQFTYALLEERVAPAPVLNGEEALFELSQRYFRSRGPATVRDFSTWSGLTLTDCRKGIQMLSPDLQGMTVDGGDHYYFPGFEESCPDIHPVILLPLYDEFIFGYKDRSSVLTYHQHLQPPPKFTHLNMILYAGQICGTWRRDPGNKEIKLEIDLFEPLDATQTSLLEKMIERYSQFKGLPVQTSHNE